MPKYTNPIIYLIGSSAVLTSGDTIDQIQKQITLLTKSIHGSVTGTGAVAATILIEGSNELAAPTWIALGTLTLSGTTYASAGLKVTDSYQYLRARLTVISGTGARVTVTLAV